MLTFLICRPEKVGQDLGYNFRNGVIPWWIRKSIKVVLNFFELAVTVSELLTFQIVDLHKVGQGHGKYQNVKKIVRCIVALVLTISEILTFQIFDLEK